MTISYFHQTVDLEMPRVAEITFKFKHDSWFYINPLIATLKLQSNGPSYNNTVIGTLAFDVWAVTFGTVRRGQGGAVADWAGCGGLDGLSSRPVPSSLYQM